MARTHGRRVVVTLLFILFGLLVAIYQQGGFVIPGSSEPSQQSNSSQQQSARAQLESLPVKGRAPKTGYSRAQFGDGWLEIGGCSTREIILNRDLKNTVINNCRIMSGTLDDPYTGRVVAFTRGELSSQAVQIDHVVALSNAWQTGAQQLSFLERQALANDPLELLAVDGAANQQKSDSDAATWLPPHKPFRCQYVERQISVKAKYRLWVTDGEKGAMKNVLQRC